MELLCGKMLVRLQECEQNCVALLSLLEAHLLEVLMKPILRLTQRFARDRYGVINTFLQHLRLGKA